MVFESLEANPRLHVFALCHSDPTASSSVEEIGYDAEAEEVLIRYRSGGLYAYLGVPAVVWEELQAAPSTGTFVNQVIKGYPYRQA